MSPPRFARRYQAGRWRSNTGLHRPSWICIKCAASTPNIDSDRCGVPIEVDVWLGRKSDSAIWRRSLCPGVDFWRCRGSLVCLDRGLKYGRFFLQRGDMISQNNGRGEWTHITSLFGSNAMRAPTLYPDVSRKLIPSKRSPRCPSGASQLSGQSLK